jgi:hypothetical protein
MKMLARFACCAVLLLPAVAFSQSHAPAATTRSVLKPADQVEWAGYTSTGYTGGTVVGDYSCCNKPIGCSTGVCMGYDNCCPRIGPLCFIKRVGRMLDCLLPCNKCCTSEPFCLFGHCKPHLFAGGHCGGCRKMGCSSCTTGCSSCSSPSGHPELADPFQDDPLPPKPMVDPAHGARSYPTPIQTYSVQKSSPYKVTTGTRIVTPAERRTAPVKSTTPDKYAGHSGVRAVPAVTAGPKSVRRASAETEEAPAPPNLLPSTVRRASAEVEVAELAIPVNPLRR